MSFYLIVGANIKKYRELRNYSLEILGNKVGVTKKTIQRYERGEIKIDMWRLGGIAKALDVKVSQLLSGTEQLIELKEGMAQYRTGEIINLPIIGRIACGNSILAFEDIEDYEPTPKGWVVGGDYFYLRAKGDSMTGARIQEGDLLLIRKQPEVENGEIAAVLLDDEAVLRRVYRNGDQLVLQSENPNYPPIFVASTKTCIIGKLKKNVIKY